MPQTVASNEFLANLPLFRTPCSWQITREGREGPRLREKPAVWFIDSKFRSNPGLELYMGQERTPK